MCFSVSIINPCFLRFITVLKSRVVLNRNRKHVMLHLQYSCNCTLRSVIFSVYPQCSNKVHWSYIYWEKNNILYLELMLSTHRAECNTWGQRASTYIRLTKILCYTLKILTCVCGGPSELQLIITSPCPWEFLVSLSCHKQSWGSWGESFPFPEKDMHFLLGLAQLQYKAGFVCHLVKGIRR